MHCCGVSHNRGTFGLSRRISLSLVWSSVTADLKSARNSNLLEICPFTPILPDLISKILSENNYSGVLLHRVRVGHGTINVSGLDQGKGRASDCEDARLVIVL